MKSSIKSDSDSVYVPDDRSSSASVSIVVPRRRQIYDYLVGGGIEEYPEREDAVKVCKI